MKAKNSIIINGRTYDAVTGMPLDGIPQKTGPQPTPVHEPAAPARPPHRAFVDIGPVRSTPAKKPSGQPRAQTPSQAMHQRTQKSQTLHRATLARPVAQAQVRSAAISKFAPAQPAAKPVAHPIKPITKKVMAHQPADAPATMHPAVAKALATMQATGTAPAKPAEARSSKELKEMLIKERLAEVSPQKQKVKKGFLKSRPRLTTILTSSLAVLLLGGYLTYINLPNISMRVAATRAGVAANFPNYKPDSFSFAGPITYSPGEVNINFDSNTNDSSFTLKQRNSSWDSQAVLDNYVAERTEKSPLTYHEKGLTIYAFDNQAAWVNGGLLYTIDGNAQLSSEQLLRLATSM